MDALQLQNLKNMVDQMGIRTHAYVLVEVHNDTSVTYTSIGGDVMMAYMVSALNAYLSAKLTPRLPVAATQPAQGLSIVSPPPEGPKPV